MHNISPTRALPTFMILTLALFLTGCGQNGASVAKVEAENNELKAKIAVLSDDKANQPAAHETESRPTSVEGDSEFKGKIETDIRNSKPDWAPFTPAKAPEDAPNILFVLYDDTGMAVSNISRAPWHIAGRPR
jgi:hypothetical protein